MRDEFSVYQFFEDGTYERVRDHVNAKEAMEVAAHYCQSVGARFGFVKRVIITDGDDYTCFEWKQGEGITFPPLDVPGGDTPKDSH